MAFHLELLGVHGVVVDDKLLVEDDKEILIVDNLVEVLDSLGVVPVH
jgi:hypothetical protein